MGVMTLSREKLDVTGPIVAATVVHDEDDLTIISTGGIVLRTKVGRSSAPAGRRWASMSSTSSGETVAAVASIAAKDLETAGVLEEGPTPPAP